MGLKFLRDNADSANLLAMNSVDGQPGDWDFFSKTWSNWVPNAVGDKQVALTDAFAWVSDHPTTVGLSDWADGGEFPFQLKFVPHTDVTSLFTRTFTGSSMAYLDQLQNDVPDNSNLFAVYAMSGPE